MAARPFSGRAAIPPGCDGAWKPGMRLPSVRKLADSCAVSTLTVTNAYNRLVAEGVIEARQG